jgi:hypothetical protein
MAHQGLDHSVEAAWKAVSCAVSMCWADGPALLVECCGKLDCDIYLPERFRS